MIMVDENQKSSTLSGVFTEAEYRTEAKNVITPSERPGSRIASSAAHALPVRMISNLATRRRR